MRMRIKRFKKYRQGIISKITLNEDFIGYGLELPYRNNKPFKSCIETGIYKAWRSNSTNFDYEVVRLADKNGRTNIEIHAGNYPEDTAGCILIGRSYGNCYVSHSGKTLNDLINRLKIGVKFPLVVCEKYKIWPKQAGGYPLLFSFLCHIIS